MTDSAENRNQATNSNAVTNWCLLALVVAIFIGDTHLWPRGAWVRANIGKDVVWKDDKSGCAINADLIPRGPIENMAWRWKVRKIYINGQPFDWRRDSRETRKSYEFCENMFLRSPPQFLVKS